MTLVSLRRRRRGAVKGFNLIEAAIVLGIVGLVVGGIWVAATSVYANLRSKAASDMLLSIAQGVRSLYATSSTTGIASADITLQVGQAGVLPGDALTTAPSNVAASGTNTANPWNGSVAVASYNAAGTQFSITFSQVPPNACMDFVLRNAGANHDAGMVGVVGAATTAAGAAIPVPGAIQAAGTLTPGVGITLANASTVCAANAAAPRNISYVFNLR